MSLKSALTRERVSYSQSPLFSGTPSLLSDRNIFPLLGTRYKAVVSVSVSQPGIAGKSAPPNCLPTNCCIDGELVSWCGCCVPNMSDCLASFSIYKEVSLSQSQRNLSSLVISHFSISSSVIWKILLNSPMYVCLCDWGQDQTKQLPFPHSARTRCISFWVASWSTRRSKPPHVPKEE